MVMTKFSIQFKNVFAGQLRLSKIDNLPASDVDFYYFSTRFSYDRENGLINNLKPHISEERNLLNTHGQRFNVITNARPIQRTLIEHASNKLLRTISNAIEKNNITDDDLDRWLNEKA